MANESNKPVIKMPAPDIGAASKPTATNVIRVSVIIPTYNGADSLPACLNALMAQDFPKSDFEIIVVDDGSTDNTAQIVKEFEGRTPIVRYFHQANQGPAAARNNGAQHAAGDIIMFTDDDCEPQRSWITEMYRPFTDRNAGIDAVKGAYRTRQKSVIACFAQTEFENRYRKMQNSQYVDFVDTYAAAFRKDVFLALKGFDTSFPMANNEDVEFSYRMAEKGHKMVFNPNAIVYHTHPDTLIRYLKVKFGRAYWRMAVYRKFPGKMQSDSYTPQSLKLQIALSFLLVASLIAEHVYKKHCYYVSIGIAAVFLLSTLPFVVSVLNFAALNKMISFIKRFLKRGFIRQLIGNIKAWFAGSALRQVCMAVRRFFKKIAIALIRLSRGIFASKAILACGRMLKTSCVLIFKAGIHILTALWWLIRLPFLLIKLAWEGSRFLCHAIAELTVTKKICAALNWLGRTRILMVPLSIIILFLRGVAMGLGILWGLQAQQSNKGRFSQAMMLMISDVLGMSGAFVAVYYAREYVLAKFFEAPPEPDGIMQYLAFAPFVILFQLVVFYLSGLYKPYRGLSQVNEFALMTKSVFTTTVILVITLYLMDAAHSKTVMLLSAFFTLVFVTMLRGLSRLAFGKLQAKSSEPNKTRILVVGTGEVARLICQKFQSAADVDSIIVGLLDKDPSNAGQKIDGYDIIGCIDDLGRIVQLYNIREVFVALPMMPQQEVMDLVDKHSDKEGVHFYIISNIFDLISAEINIAEHSNIPIACLRNEQMALAQMLAKRVFDAVVAALVILLTFPFWILIMIAIRLETDGPAIFRQERVGKNGKIFQIYKFRTMRSDVDKYEYSPSAPDDQRITKVGGFLRKTSLDEFPQFLNVFKGEMSLVGPRPEMPFLVEKYKDWERQRLKVKPGLTGLWQIMGRKDLPLHESLEYDFYYIKNQSLLLDLTILIKTIPIIFLGKGAY